MRFLGTAQLLMLAGAAFYLIANLVVSAVVPGVVRSTATWSPARRHRALTFVGAAPLGLSLVAMLSVLLPSALALRWPEFDHCLMHDDGHAHLCFMHPSGHPGAWPGWLILAGAGAWALVRLITGTAALLHASRLVRRLFDSAEPAADGNVWVIPTTHAICLSAGVFRPRLMLSAGLLASIRSDELEVMTAHEEAHRLRKDTLVCLVLRAATLSLVPSSRDLLLAALELSSEQACDEDAARRVGDRLLVAETILAMERRLTETPELCHNLLVAGFGSSTAPERVEAMLRPPNDTGASLHLAGSLFAVVVALLASSTHLHHATESLLGFLSH